MLQLESVCSFKSVILSLVATCYAAMQGCVCLKITDFHEKLKGPRLLSPLLTATGTKLCGESKDKKTWAMEIAYFLIWNKALTLTMELPRNQEMLLEGKVTWGFQETGDKSHSEELALLALTMAHTRLWEAVPMLLNSVL